MTDDTFDDTLDRALRGGSRGLLGEFRDFMAENAKWWLAPFLVVFGLLGAALVLGSTGAAPFVYALF